MWACERVLHYIHGPSHLKSILASDPLPIYPISFRQFVYNIPETPNSKHKTKEMNGCYLEVTRQLLEVHGNAKLLHAIQTSTDLVLMKSPPLIQVGRSRRGRTGKYITTLSQRGKRRLLQTKRKKQPLRKVEA